MHPGDDRRTERRALRRRALVAVVVLVLGLGSAAALAAETKLGGTVGPGFSISLRDDAGNPVSSLAAGAYEIEVDDLSDEHNFHLSGPGVDVATDVAGTGSQTFRVTLQDGRYTFLCDPHPTRMRGAFGVGASTGGGSTGGGSTGGGGSSGGGTTTPPTAAKPSAAVGSRLVLTTGPGFTITLRTTAGKKVTRLRPGAYTVLVRDRATSHNARLRGAGASKATTVPFVGTKTWKVVLKKGKLTFVCDPHASSMRGSVVVG
jgi:plastocyanin